MKYMLQLAHRPILLFSHRSAEYSRTVVLLKAVSLPPETLACAASNATL